VIKRVLNVGCGPNDRLNLHETFRNESWQETRLDIDPSVRPDIVASIVDMQGVEPESYDAIWSSHNLEHLFAHDVPRALAEFQRVLKADGFALITVPDLQAAAELIAQGKTLDPAYVSPLGPISPLDIVFGLQASIARGNTHMAHRTGFTRDSLATTLRSSGFPFVQVERGNRELWSVASKVDRGLMLRPNTPATAA
jgi:SAM-dependent methyltransferase